MKNYTYTHCPRCGSDNITQFGENACTCRNCDLDFAGLCDPVAIKRWREARLEECFGHHQRRVASFDIDDKLNPEISELVQAYTDNFAENFEDTSELTPGLLLNGACDAGKTFFCECIANALIEHFDVRMRSVPELVDIAQRSSLNNEEWENIYLGCDLLILDDLGAERDTSFAQECVYKIVDGRYRRGLPMVVSTNLTKEELANPKDIISDRIYSRLLEVCLQRTVPDKRKRCSRQTQQSLEDKIFRRGDA